MKKIIKTTAIMLILAGMVSCGKENNEPVKIKIAYTEWLLKGIVDVETGTIRELDVEHLEYTGCRTLYFDTDTTAYGCAYASEIYLNLSPQQVFVVIKNENDSYTGDIKLFYDTIKTITAYYITTDNDIPSELKLYCNKGKNYLHYKKAIYY
ncbi:MAG: hypothetical protein LBP85_04915 [Prevotellaceae bacterium]|jgi:hypothetical protein|nr:hypothetical protein [Prevotellaceae bacterium]